MSINLSEYKGSKKKKSSGFDIQEILNKDISFGSKFSDKKKEQFYKQLAILLKSKIDFEESLNILSEHFKKKTDKEYIQKIRDSLIKGRSFFESISDLGIFTPYEIYSIKIGEETKRLEVVLDELQKYFDKKIKMKRQIVSVMTYPIFVLVVTFGVLYFMLNNVVPMFGSIFNQFGEELPDITKKIIYLSDNFSTIIQVFLFVVISIVLSHHFLKNKDVYKRVTTKVLLKIPFWGNFVKKIYLSRLTQSLSLMLASKTPLINALELAEEMINFYPLTISLPQVRSDIMKGEPLYKSFEKHAIYDHKIVSMVKVAEQINTLDEAFDNITEQYNEEIEHNAKMIGVVLEPIIITVIGTIVGVIMIAMYSPIFNLSKVLG